MSSSSSRFKSPPPSFAPKPPPSSIPAESKKMPLKPPLQHSVSLLYAGEKIVQQMGQQQQQVFRAQSERPGFLPKQQFFERGGKRVSRGFRKKGSKREMNNIPFACVCENQPSQQAWKSKGSEDPHIFPRRRRKFFSCKS